MFNRLTLTRRFWIVVCVYWVVFAFAMITGITGLMQARDSLNIIHDNRLHATELLSDLQANFYDSRLHVLLAFQHDPLSPLYELHFHMLDLHVNAIQDNTEADKTLLAELKALALNEQEKALLNKVSADQAAWLAKQTAAIDALEASDFSPETMRDFLEAGRAEGTAFLSVLNEVSEYQAEQADIEAEQATTRYRNAQIYFVLIVLFGALPVTWFMLLTLRRMSNGFTEANNAAQAIAKGDLTQNIHPDGSDEIAGMLTQIRHMQQNLRELISQINRSASTIVSVSTRVADGSALLSERTDQQAASLEETSAATEELNSTVEQNAANAREAENMADQADVVARRGGKR